MSPSELPLELEQLRKRLERERRARHEAEAIAEQGTRLLYERSRQIQLLYVIADASSRADSTEAAIQVALDEICAYTAWPIGHAYMVVNDPLHPLVPTTLWHLDDGEHFTAFREASEKLRFQRGEGLPGRVLESRKTVWLSDVSSDGNFPRAAVAHAAGVRGAFAIPVLARNAVVAVLEFFSREVAEPEENWLEVTAQVGTQVGRTFEREARDEADRANRAKSEFLSRMSHELRTPLNAILGFGQLLEMEVTGSDQLEAVRHILKGGRHLLSLINEVLDISRIEAGNIRLSLEPVRVGDVLLEVLDLIRPLATQRTVSLEAIPALDPHWHVAADLQRLKQILINLVSNAIKYNRPGGTVRLDCNASDGRLRFNVTDTGAGIPAHKLEQLFIPFERLDAEQSSVEGTGLGLALSKHLAELMGGTMGVESTPGQGSTFWLEMPTAKSPLASIDGQLLDGEESACVSHPQRSVLYIEDNLPNLELVKRLLGRRPNLKLLAAMEAGTGITLAADHQPDLILLDLNLPDMNGHEALLHLQGNARTSEIPVVVISADATSGQVHRLLAAGAAAYLTKPLEVPRFFETVDRMLAGTQA